MSLHNKFMMFIIIHNFDVKHWSHHKCIRVKHIHIVPKRPNILFSFFFFSEEKHVILFSIHFHKSWMSSVPNFISFHFVFVHFSFMSFSWKLLVWQGSNGQYCAHHEFFVGILSHLWIWSLAFLNPHTYALMSFVMMPLHHSNSHSNFMNKYFYSFSVERFRFAKTNLYFPYLNIRFNFKNCCCCCSDIQHFLLL